MSNYNTPKPTKPGDFYTTPEVLLKFRKNSNAAFFQTLIQAATKAAHRNCHVREREREREREQEERMFDYILFLVL